MGVPVCYTPALGEWTLIGGSRAPGILVVWDLLDRLLSSCSQIPSLNAWHLL